MFLLFFQDHQSSYEKVTTMERFSKLLILLLSFKSAESLSEEENGTAYSNESDYSNETAYECLGASKEELKLYSTLSWWMEAVFQVS
jgi:hypothetical protein